MGAVLLIDCHVQEPAPASTSSLETLAGGGQGAEVVSFGLSGVRWLSFVTRCVVLCGVVWCGVVLYGKFMVLCCIVWRGMVWCAGTPQYGGVGPGSVENIELTEVCCVCCDVLLMLCLLWCVVAFQCCAGHCVPLG